MKPAKFNSGSDVKETRRLWPLVDGWFLGCCFATAVLFHGRNFKLLAFELTCWGFVVVWRLRFAEMQPAFASIGSVFGRSGAGGFTSLTVARFWFLFTLLLLLLLLLLVMLLLSLFVLLAVWFDCLEMRSSSSFDGFMAALVKASPLTVSWPLSRDQLQFLFFSWCPWFIGWSLLLVAFAGQRSSTTVCLIFISKGQSSRLHCNCSGGRLSANQCGSLTTTTTIPMKGNKRASSDAPTWLATRMCLEPTKGDAWAREIKETTWPIDRRRRGRRGPDDRHNGRRPIQISYFQIGNICPVHLHFLLPRGSVPTAQWITTELSIPSSAEFTTSWLQNSTKVKSYEPFIQTTT